MPRFILVGGGSVTSLILPSARAALETAGARNAPVGSELRNDGGHVIASKERLDFEDGWILAWKLTGAWSEAMPPVDLELGAGVDPDGHLPAAE